MDSIINCFINGDPMTSECGESDPEQRHHHHSQELLAPVVKTLVTIGRLF